jgi:hypothetical protein
MPEYPSKTHPLSTALPEPSVEPPAQGGQARLSKPRVALTFLVAATSDVISVWTELVPPVQWAVDLLTALLLFMSFGWQWALLPGFVAEAIPGFAAFPVWTVVAAAVALWGRLK